MGSRKLKGKHVNSLDFPKGEITGLAIDLVNRYFGKKSIAEKVDVLRDVIENKDKYRNDEMFGILVARLEPQNKPEPTENYDLKQEKLHYKTYGISGIEQAAIDQMETAMKLPITLAGALMPDAHQGYGLPIGGVLATQNAVIPYAVGVDIGCRMCMSVFSLPEKYIDRYQTNLKRILVDNTRFGQKDVFEDKVNDPVLERKEFREIPALRPLHGKAIMQIGTSGSGNHFVEYGDLEIISEDNEYDLKPGKYIAVLSHSGSRWLGHEIAKFYTSVAMEKCGLPRNAKHLAWLDLNSQEGQEYWLAMNLAGDYASANHRDIHRRIAKAMKEKPIAIFENHHNFAWKEKLPDGKEAIIHRKGATPAAIGSFGIIPGSMATPAFLVKGKGNEFSLNSASHGAGRRMSRSKAKNSFSGKELRQFLQKARVELIGGGTDESPMAYKDIRKVMEYQKDLVDIIGEFHPRIVRMDG